MTNSAPALVDAKHLRKTFRGHSGERVYAVNDVSMTVRAGETVGLIGESGSGKSTLGRLLLGLLAPDSGEVIFDGAPIVPTKPREMRRIRTKMQVVFQEPYESLNPRMRIESLVAEPLVVQGDMEKPERVARVAEVLDLVGLRPELARRYPGELSGGQQQRVGIARAIVGRPRLVVLDEPTASLDRTIRRQITDLLLKVQADLGLAYLLITHDIASVRRMADRSLVMFRGHLVESGPTSAVLAEPAHPYTRALVSAELPARLGAAPDRYRLKPRLTIGEDIGPSCALLNVCPLAIQACATALPPLLPAGDGHMARCIRLREVQETSAHQSDVGPGPAPAPAADTEVKR